MWLLCRMFWGHSKATAGAIAKLAAPKRPSSDAFLFFKHHPRPIPVAFALEDQGPRLKTVEKISIVAQFTT